MKQRIFKYQLAMADVQDISIPQGAKILHVGWQYGVMLCMWVMLNPSDPSALRKIEIFGTGHLMPDPPDGLSRVHLATVIDETSVWHVFELVEVEK
jgi:hypothetical protein